MRATGPARDRRAAWPVAVAVALLVAGALAGVLWWALWTPPTGVALAGEFVLDSDGARSAFDATGTFVLIALVLGLVAGLVVGWVTRRDELAVVGVATVAAVVAGLLMYAVGHLLGPPDPSSLADGAEDYTPLVGDLTLAGPAPWLALPGGLLVGLVVTLLGFARSADRPDAAHGKHGERIDHTDHGDHGAGTASLDWRGTRPERTP